jgi:predicted transcriptional regulator
MPTSLEKEAEAGTGVARLSVNLAHDTMEVLRWLASRRAASVTETIRRAISVLKFVEDEVAKGNKLAVVETDEDGKEHLREIVLVG